MVPRSIGPYVVTSKIGEGGMGVVYRAHDPRLGRDVAIKVLPEAFARDPDRMARFEREARTLASLNHPNIATLHGLEQNALVMEFVDGPTLAERMRGGPVPLDEALAIARQIADGLEAAHERAVIHRDLKPANIKINAEGRVKILDFGLAKAAEQSRAVAAGDPANSPTLTMPGSEVGMIMGTAGYMSPEQARGARVDHRTDIWAFGVVLWEMVTGRPLFLAETVTDTLAAVLAKAPEIDAAPPRLRGLLGRCLERDLRLRLGWIGEMRLMLDAPKADQAPAPHGARPRWIAAVAALLGLAVGWVAFRSKPVELPVRALSLPVAGLDASGLVRRAAISPDGTHVAYVAENKLWIRALDAEQPRAAEGGDGAQGPFWSPDSKQVAFVTTGSELKRVSLAGGSPITVALAPGGYRGGAWSPDGNRIVLATTGGGITEHALLPGAAARTVIKPRSDGIIHSPCYLGTGDHPVLIAGIGNVGRQELIAISPTTGRFEKLGPGGYPDCAPNREVIYQPEAAGAGLFALRLDPGTGKPVGDPQPLVNLGTHPSVSREGTLVWNDAFRGSRQQFTRRDRAGNKLGVAGAPGALRMPRLSPDDSRVAYWARSQGNEDVWVLDLGTGASSRVTSDPGTEIQPVWSRTGRDLVYGTLLGAPGVYRQAADGSGSRTLVVPHNSLPTDWSGDGTILLLSSAGDIFWSRRRPDGGFEQPQPFAPSPFAERTAHFSENERFVVYLSEETGRSEVYVREFPSGQGKRQISAGGGNSARWSRDGREIFYVEGSTLKAVPVTQVGAFTAGRPVTLFTHPSLTPIGAGRTWDVSQDGKWFLVAEDVDPTGQPAIHVVQNWPALLRRAQPAEP